MSNEYEASRAKVLREFDKCRDSRPLNHALPFNTKLTVGDIRAALAATSPVRTEPVAIYGKPSVGAQIEGVADAHKSLDARESVSAPLETPCRAALEIALAYILDFADPAHAAATLRMIRTTLTPPKSGGTE